MPKRTTLTFTSEDAPQVEEGKLFAYHCKYSGRHALTLGASSAGLVQPRRISFAVCSRHMHRHKHRSLGLKLVASMAPACMHACLGCGPTAGRLLLASCSTCNTCSSLRSPMHGGKPELSLSEELHKYCASRDYVCGVCRWWWWWGGGGGAP